jgi:hypothetical protein
LPACPIFLLIILFPRSRTMNPGPAPLNWR